MKGIVLYKGKSNLNDSNIVVIMTLNSANRKTGNMAQTWILNQDVSPVEAVKTGADVSVCGVCPLRQSIGGACYVNVGQAPLAVWRAWRAGKYVENVIDNQFTASDLLAVMLRHKTVRFGAYGDPAAAPTYIWSVLAKYAKGYTGYTHQVNHVNFDKNLSEFCMISVETIKQAQLITGLAPISGSEHKAQHNSRTFRVITTDAPLLPNEILCPSGEGIECRDCLLCSGNGYQPSIAIEVHGGRTNKHNAKYANANIIKTVEV
tara:strand:- start:31217 stop:32002 length:786 start_codon:yes stop_codon:yes gene_type:complete